MSLPSNLRDNFLVFYAITVIIFLVAIVVGKLFFKLPPLVKDWEDVFFFGAFIVAPIFNIIFFYWFVKEMKGQFVARKWHRPN